MQNYNKSQQFLHDFVLKNKFINKSLFELEKIIYLKNIEIIDQPHIFITGLPRSGTTILLYFLYSSNEYASLTYKSMPFILSPNFSNLFHKKKMIKKERMHGDGITYDIDSPEALDEVFFNTGDDFIKNELVNYFQLVCLSQNRIKYLSKNNLNFNRIDLISKFFPNCNFLIPIRDPLQHSFSLLRQHLHFSELQKKDDFIRRYMNYLGHNEFGLNHKPWNQPINYQELDKIDYWLEQWFLFYRNILNKYQSYKNCHFVVYEKLTDANYLKKLLKKINFSKIEDIDINYLKNLNKEKINTYYSKDIFENANKLYNNFKDKY